jgi:probable F420-dependent oxidoreductase
VTAPLRVGLQIGAITSPGEPLGDIPAFAAAVEEMGFDSLWLGEHLLWSAAFLDPLAVIAAASGVTDRLLLGTSVLILPLHHPVRLAKTAATLDILSGGRLLLGVGVGGENPEEFRAMGVGHAGRGRRADEAMTLLRRLWRERDVTHDGPSFPLHDVTLRPPPTSPQGPPLWVGGRSAAARRRAALLADGWMPYLVSPGQLSDGRAAIEDLRHERGLEGPFETAVHLFVGLGTRDGGAREVAALLESLYRVDLLERVGDRCLVGSAAACVDRALRYVEAGARHVVLQVAHWGPTHVEAVEAVATGVLPALRREAAHVTTTVPPA